MSRSNKLAPEANRYASLPSLYLSDLSLRILFIKNLTYNLDPPALFDLFGKFGPIRQIRQGNSPSTKGTAFVVYDEVADAKQACDKLNGFNFMNRYLVVLYHQPEKMVGKSGADNLAERQERLEKIKRENNID
jgi:pre-mRNA branch site protein p14